MEYKSQNRFTTRAELFRVSIVVSCIDMFTLFLRFLQSLM